MTAVIVKGGSSRRQRIVLRVSSVSQKMDKLEGAVGSIALIAGGLSAFFRGAHQLAQLFDSKQEDDSKNDEG